MNKQFLFQHICREVSLSDSEASLVLNAFHSKELQKQEILLFQGEISSHMRFIAKGCLKSYYVDKGGQEHILQFGIEDWWLNDLYSYLTQTSAKLFLQAIEPSVVLQIHRDDLEALYASVPVMERFFRLKMQRAYVATQERTLNAMNQPAERRYLAFREKYRAIEQRVPQYMIASYLGITPEFLSTIRSRRSE